MTDQSPKFEGDPNSIVDVRKHLTKLRLAKTDLTDPDAVQEYLDNLNRETSGLVGMKKSEQDDWQRGQQIADFVNGDV